MRLRQAREDPSPRCIEAIVAVVKQFAALGESNEMLMSSPGMARQHHLLHATALHHVGDVMLDRATGVYICMCQHTCILCVHVCACTCAYVCVHVCVCIRTCVCMCMCVHVWGVQLEHWLQLSMLFI